MKTRARVAIALILIALGVWFLAIEFYPPLKTFAYSSLTWPLPIIGVGALLGLFALVLWTPGLWIPACIVGGIGGLLYWQNQTGNWGSWAYAWALIPGFVGVGMLIAGLLSCNHRQIVGAGWNIFTSLVLFAIFGSFLGGITILSLYWPVLLILLGVILLAQGFYRRK